MRPEEWIIYGLSFALSVFIALYGTPIAMKAAVKFGIVDRPDGFLKVHRDPVPYLGGLAIYMAFLLSLAMTFEFSKDLLGILLGATVIVLLGLIDDFGVLTPKVKFFGQFIAAFVLIKSGTMIYLEWLPLWLRIVLSTLWIVGVTNAFNIIDVMDGLSSGVAAVAALVLSVIAIMNGKLVIAITAVSLAGACFGFLRYNFTPARIYMGDTGSMFLGFTLAALSIGNTIGSYTSKNIDGFFAPVLILGVPIFDTAFVMFLRWRKGLSVFKGSNDHYAIRLKRAGWTVRKVVLTSYAAGFALGGFALYLINISNGPTVGILLGIFVLAVLLIAYLLGRIDIETAG